MQIELGKVKSKGQGTIEYLVIIAVVIVIALVVVGIISGIFGDSSAQVLSGGEALGNVSNSAGINIVDSVSDPSGNGLITLQNLSPDTVTISQITTPEGGGGTFNTNVTPGDSRTFSLNDLNASCLCSAGEVRKICNFIFSITTASGLEKQETVSVTVDCSTQNVNPGDRVIPPLDSTAPQVALSSPSGTILYANPITFTYTATDNTAVSSCSLLINGAVAQTDSTAPFGSFTQSMTLGKYNWSVSCQDARANTAVPTAVDFNVFTAFPVDYFFYKNSWPTSSMTKISSTTGALLATLSTMDADAYHTFYLDSDRNYLWVPHQHGSATPQVPNLIKIDSISTTKIGQYSSPCPDIYSGIVDGSGNVYLGGGWNSRVICKYDTSGTNVSNFTPDANITTTLGLTIDSSSNLWIYDLGANGTPATTTVQKLDSSTGTKILEFETDCNAATFAIPLDAFKFDSLGQLWLACETPSKTYVYSSTGTKLYEFNFKTLRITPDQLGKVYLLSSDRNIMKVDASNYAILWNNPLSYADTVTHFFIQPTEDKGQLIVGRQNASGYISTYDTNTGLNVNNWTSGSTQTTGSIAAQSPDPNGFYHWMLYSGKK